MYSQLYQPTISINDRIDANSDRNRVRCELVIEGTTSCRTLVF